MATFNLRAVVTSMACASLALAGIVSPAFAEEADRTVFLREGESETVTGYFLEGESIFATCDEDCTDIDLYLYTDLDVQVDSDDELDAFPIVVAPYDGEFSVQLDMHSCSYSAGCVADISSEHGF